MKPGRGMSNTWDYRSAFRAERRDDVPIPGDSKCSTLFDMAVRHRVATVIASAVIPKAFANAFFMPGHLLPRAEEAAPKLSGPVIDTGQGVS